jgi:aarF domain-containing kinase
VYKGVLRNGGETVAVKVQRPFVLETVSLDLFLMREAAELVNPNPLKPPYVCGRCLDPWTSEGADL